MAVPIILFVAHASIFGSWVVDDAAISWAYARSLAAGYGLVAQPDLAPVEGYSNPLWMLIHAPFFMFGLFHPVLVPKLLGLSCVIAAFALYYRRVAKSEAFHCLAATIGLSLIALQSAVVIWSISGLENGLYLLLVTSLALTMASSHRHRASGAGLLAGAVSLTRPDGVLYALAYPLVLLIRARRREPFQSTREWRWYAFGLLSLLLPFLAFRIYYFGEVVPNTYYAKGGPTLETIAAIALLDPGMLSKLGGLSLSTIGVRSGAWLLIIGGLLIFKARRTIAGDRLLLSELILLVISIAAYLALPSDWMTEYRFATPFFVLFYLFGARMGAFYLKQSRSTFIVAAICASLGLTALLTVPRSLAFAARPAISVNEVMETANRFERMAAMANIEKPSLLIADVGGALLANSMRIYDLGMLTDRTIARTLGEAVKTPDRARFYQYVFEEARPSFIALRAYHSLLARLGDDPRLRRDYVPIIEYTDEWIRQRYGIVMPSGDFVRKDALGARGDELAREFRQLSRGIHYVGCMGCE